MRDDNVSQVGDLTSHLLNHLDDKSAVLVVKGVYEGEVVSVVDEKGMHPATLLLTEAEDPLTNLPEVVFRVQAGLH